MNWSATMSMEYHAWIVLGTFAPDWDDGDWDRACEEVRQVLACLRPEDGHQAQMSEPTACPATVALCGFGVKSIDLVKDVLARIATIGDASYGELVVRG